MKEKLTQERLKEILSYDPKSGIFTRKIIRPGVKVGSIAGCNRKDGYIEIKINNKSYKAHRLAWLYVYGYFPENGLDHIDRAKHNNWIKNLREVSQQCNMRNRGNFKNNTSGVKGVSWQKRRKNWKAEIRVDLKLRNLGRYKSFDNAVCARLAGEQCVNWAGCDSSSPAFKYVKNMFDNVL